MKIDLGALFLVVSIHSKSEVNFKVKGTDLVGVLNNYNSKKSRI